MMLRLSSPVALVIFLSLVILTLNSTLYKSFSPTTNFWQQVTGHNGHRFFRDTAFQICGVLRITQLFYEKHNLCGDDGGL